VVAILDKKSNLVHLVSAYEQGGRGETEVAKTKEGTISKPAKSKLMVVDPGKPGSRNAPTSTFRICSHGRREPPVDPKSNTNPSKP
jgi:hypothetical protein